MPTEVRSCDGWARFQPSRVVCVSCTASPNRWTLSRPSCSNVSAGRPRPRNIFNGSRSNSMNDTRRYLLESVDDAAVVQLYADGFSALDLRDKILVWHLYLAAIAGRDIYYDQRYAHNLEMRALLEMILTHGASVDSRVLDEIRRYMKLFWINTGPYNNLTARKFVLHLTRDELLDALTAARRAGAEIAVRPGESLAGLVDRMAPLFFDVAYDPILTNKTP